MPWLLDPDVSWAASASKPKMTLYFRKLDGNAYYPPFGTVWVANQRGEGFLALRLGGDGVLNADVDRVCVSVDIQAAGDFVSLGTVLILKTDGDDHIEKVLVFRVKKTFDDADRSGCFPRAEGQPIRASGTPAAGTERASGQAEGG